MATRGLTFIETRAPRAAGLPKRDIDKHKELIGDLYLGQNQTRDQVIDHLKTNFGFTLSRDQFSKATRRWGFQKQRRGRRSTQPSLNSSDVSSYPMTAPSAYRTALNALSGNPTMCRSLASHSSGASQVSVSSSFKRFKASALKIRDSAESMVEPSRHDFARQLRDDSPQRWRFHEFGNYYATQASRPTIWEDDSKLPQGEWYTGQEEELEED